MAKKTTKTFDDYGLLRVATAIPTVKVADVEYNLKQHIQLILDHLQITAGLQEPGMQFIIWRHRCILLLPLHEQIAIAHQLLVAE